MAPIQLTVQAIRAARVSPSSWHLRAICNYLESRLAGWFEQQTKPCSQSAESPSVSSEASSAWTTTAKACNPNGRDGDRAEQFETNSKPTSYSLAVSQTRLRGSGKVSRPNFLADSLSELGISYTVRSSLPSGERARLGVMGALGTDPISSPISLIGSVIEGKETFAPGRTKGRALVRRLSRAAGGTRFILRDGRLRSERRNRRRSFLFGCKRVLKTTNAALAPYCLRRLDRFMYRWTHRHSKPILDGRL